MIITIDPTNSEDIAAFAMVKQYNLQNAIAEIATTEWSTISGSTRVTCTKALSPVSGGGIMYAGDNICAIVSYALEGNNYDVASQAGVIVDSVSLANDTDIVYTVVFSADELPTSTVKLDLIIYGDKMVGQETGEPVSAEEITAQVLATINGRLTNLESGLLINDSVAKLGIVTAGSDTNPIKMVNGIPTPVSNELVSTIGNQTILGTKTIERVISENLVRSMYYSVASGSDNVPYPWRLLYKLVSPSGSNTNAFLTLAYSGTRANSKSGQTPAVVTILGYGTSVQASGIGDSATTCVKVIKEADGKAWVFGRADNNNSGSGSCCFNVIGMRNEERWEKIPDVTLCSITNGVATDSNGTVVVSGTEIPVTSNLATETYVGNALDGYLPMVRTTGNQDIAGVKTFQNSIINKMFYTNKADTAGVWIKVATASMPAGAQHNYTFVVQSAYYHSHPWAGKLYYGLWDNGGIGSFRYIGSSAIAGRFRMARKSDKTYDLWYLNPTGENYNGVRGIITEESVGSARSNVWHAVETADQTTKPSASGDWSEYASTLDVSLMGSDDYVRTTGAQTIAGVKTFTDILIKKSSGVDMSTTPSAQQTVAQLDFQDKNGTAITRFRTYHETNGNSELSIILPQQGWNGLADYQQPRMRFITGAVSGLCSLTLSKASNTYIPSASEQLATVGILDAYTPMVRTSGAQTIGGIKTFDDPVYGRFIYPLYEEYSGNLPSGKYRIFARIPSSNPNTMLVLDAMISANGSNYGFGRILVGNPTTVSWFCKWVYRKSNAWLSADVIQIAKETATGDLLIFAKNPTITGLSINLVYDKYGSSIHGARRVTKVTSSSDYSLDGTDAGIESITAGSDMA